MKVKILCIFFIANFWAVHAQLKPLFSIPFTVEKNCIYIYCKVNEQDSVKFLFDTGADGSVINEFAREKLKLALGEKMINTGSNGTNEVETSTGNSFTIGTIAKTNVNFMIIPFGDANFDGIIGTDLMKGNIISIDYDKGEMTFYPENASPQDFEGYERQTMYQGIYPTYIKARTFVAGKSKTGLYGLDTGADNALTFASPYVVKNDLEHKMPQIGSTVSQGSDGSTYEQPLVMIPELNFAGKTLYQIPADLSKSVSGIDASDKLAGFFGNSFLKRFNIILDYKNNLIYFKLNKNLYSPFF